MTDEQAKVRAINAWKRENRRKTLFGSRLMFAFNVPGTREHGTLAMMNCQSARSFKAKLEAHQ